MKTQEPDRDLVQVGFKVSIEIHCETEDEIMSHLHVIRDEYRRHLRKRKGVIEDGAGLQWEDDNCYGGHTVTIEPELA